MWGRSAAVGFTVLVVLTGCGGGGSDGASGESGAGTQYVAGDGSTVVLAPAERQPAPDVVGVTLDGTPWALRDTLGQVTVLNVWASWCAPCRAEAPTLQATYADRAEEGVAFVGLDTRDSQAAAEAFVRNYAITYPNVRDPDGQLQLAFRETLPPQSIPSTLFIDKQGRVAARVLGEVDSARLNGIIDELLIEPAT